VLLVEDDADVREAFEALIEVHGFSVASVRTGREAFLRLRDGAWCLIILDWWLPDMDGEQFHRQLVADPTLAPIPIAVCTADAHIKKRAAAVGIQHVLLKPIEAEELVAVLDRHCTKAA